MKPKTKRLVRFFLATLTTVLIPVLVYAAALYTASWRDPAQLKAIHAVCFVVASMDVVGCAIFWLMYAEVTAW